MVTTDCPGLPLHQLRGPARHRPQESRLLLDRVLSLLHPAQHHHPPLIHSHHNIVQVTVVLYSNNYSKFFNIFSKFKTKKEICLESFIKIMFIIVSKLLF